jgi:hypothetical protein
LVELTLAEETPIGPRLLHRYERRVRLTVKGYMSALWLTAAVNTIDPEMVVE